MAFDFGLKRIGVAVGQSLTGTAEPLETVVNARRGGTNWDRIGALIEVWGPQAFVVGVPLNMDGTEQEITPLARRFGRSLSGRFGVPVHWADERLSTREARQRHTADGRKRHDSNDHFAAQVILEGWFTEFKLL